MKAGVQTMNEVQTVPPIRFSQTVEVLRQAIEAAPTKLPLSEVILIFGPKGHVLLTLFFVLPFLQPIPIPGLSTALGFCIFMVGGFMLLGRPPWVPDWIARICVEKHFLLRVTGAMERLLQKVEHVVRPRGRQLIGHPRLSAFHGFLIAAHAFLLALPLPVPFSNFLPAIVLLLVALGCLEEDFLVVCLGYVAAVANAAFFGALLWSPFLIHRLLT